MSASLLEMAPPEIVSPETSLGDDTVRARVLGLLGESIFNRQLRERRRDQRYPYPNLIGLTPVADDGKTPDGETFFAVGKHLSERGLDFYHQEPLPHRRVIVSLETPEGWIGFLMELTWCRFTKHGWYDNGGRFLRVVESPLAETELPPLLMTDE